MAMNRRRTAAAATTHVRVFEHGHAAHAFQAYAFTDKAHVAEGLRGQSSQEAYEDPTSPTSSKSRAR